MEAVRAAPKDAQGEGEKERELAKAALSVAELDALLAPGSDEENAGQNGNAVTGGDGGEEGEGGSDGPIPLQTLDFVRAYAPLVDKARDAIITEMEAMVVSGLGSLNQPLLSSSLQTAHNLGLLPELVSNLVADLNDAVGQRVRRAFDSAAIGREVSGKDGGGIRFTTKRAQTEPSAAAAPQWQAVLWNRLEKVMDDVANCCIKVSCILLGKHRADVPGVHAGEGTQGEAGQHDAAELPRRGAYAAGRDAEFHVLDDFGAGV